MGDLEDSAESGEPDSISASEHSPQPLNTGSHAPRPPPHVQDGARQDYVPVQLRSWGVVHAAWLGSFEETPTRTACGYPLDASSITKEVDLSLALCRRPACVFARKAGRA